MDIMNTQAQWRLWLDYLLAKADGDEDTAAQKLKELTATMTDTN